MTKHKYFNKEKLNYLNYLKKLLNYHNILYCDCELRSYTIKELKYLNNIYKIKFNNISKKYNSWYRTNNIYTI